MLPYTCLSCSCIWSYFRPFPKRFRCDWLTYQARSVRVHFTRRAMHASCESPWHSLAKHHLLGACFPRMLPFRSMLLTLRGGPQCLAPRAHRIPVYPMVLSTFLCRAFTAHIAIAVPAVLFRGIWRGLSLQDAVVRKETTGDHEPLLGSRSFAFQTSLHAACDHLNPNRPFLAVSHGEPPPRSRVERCAPLRHRLPRGFRSSSAPLILG